MEEWNGSTNLTNIAKSEWLTILKQTLKAWHRSVEIGQNSLANLHIVKQEQREKGYANDINGRAAALRNILRKGIQSLGVPGQTLPENEDDKRWLERSWRSYAILHLRYLRGLSRTEIQNQIGLAEGGQYYTEQRQAIEMLALILQDWEGYPEEESSPLLLEFPSGAVKLTDQFYIERNEDFDLRQQIQKPGQTLTITGPRQVGKTSMLIRGIHQAIQTLEAQIVYIDFQAVSQTSLTSSDIFLRTVANWLIDELGLESSEVKQRWQGQLGSARKLTKLIEQYIFPTIDKPLVFALDEVDRLLGTPFHTEFFGLLRSWHNLRAWNAQWSQFTLLMAISTEPYLLINDLQQSPFNVGLMLYLTDFTPKEVEKLNQIYGTPLNEAELDNLFELLNGHPYLTRLALYTIVKQQMSYSALNKLAIQEQGPFISHLRYLHHLLNNDSMLMSAMKEVLLNRQCTNDILRHRLQKAGLIRLSGTAVFPRCDLYGRYFTKLV